jgi:hypothetical protein
MRFAPLLGDWRQIAVDVRQRQLDIQAGNRHDGVAADNGALPLSGCVTPMAVYALFVLVEDQLRL